MTTWDAVMGKAPPWAEELSDDELDRVLAAIADFVDLKSPYTLGHSRGVAELAAAAAAELGATPGRYAGPDWCTTWVEWVSLTRSGTSVRR